jgi:hypothetical protein
MTDKEDEEQKPTQLEAAFLGRMFMDDGVIED